MICNRIRIRDFHDRNKILDRFLLLVDWLLVGWLVVQIVKVVQVDVVFYVDQLRKLYLSLTSLSWNGFLGWRFIISDSAVS